MRLDKLLAGVGVIETNAPPETEISGISYDSRSTKQGDVFA